MIKFYKANLLNKLKKYIRNNSKDRKAILNKKNARSINIQK